MTGAGGFRELIERKKEGSLKIYLGYAAGVGKTYEMLQEGQRLRKSGLDVIIGYVEPHDRPETSALVSGLEEVPRRFHSVGGREFPEMDVPAILKRAPQVVLVDELAHSNVAGAKNEKRYQDVLEILEHGINVISTLNVQHMESVAEKVAVASRVPVQERIPDQVLRRADQIVVVDVSMEELRERLRRGKIYEKSKADLALQKFFTYENLSFLREMCLREVAGDQVRKIEAQGLLDPGASDLAQEAVMVALSSDPSHAEVLLRKATRLASQLSTHCYAVYIQKGKESATMIDSALQRKLQNNLKLAKSLGAEIVTIQSENIVESLVTFATTHHVRHAVFGKSRRTPLVERIKGSLMLEFIHDSVGIDVHIVTTTGEEAREITSHA
jgi:two-component system sensor histidine kinase KdpD